MSAHPPSRWLWISLAGMVACLDPGGGTDELGEDTQAEASEADTAEPGPCASDPCQNGGACMEQADGYACACEPGWEGQHCEIDIDECAENPCVNGVCIDGIGEHACECEPSWTGEDCSTYVDPCADFDCGYGSCYDNFGEPTCWCPHPWGGRSCDQLAMPLCLQGELMIVDALDMIDAVPATGVFEALEGVNTYINFRFDVIDHYTMIGDGIDSPSGKLRVIETGPITVTSTNPFLEDVFGAAFTGTNQVITLVNGDFEGVYFGSFVSPEGPEYWGFELTDTPMPLVIADDGFPELLPAGEDFGYGSPILRRFQDQGPLISDQATAIWTMEFNNGGNCGG